MEGLAVIGFVFGMLGIVALVRIEKLIKTLKKKRILEQNYKEEYLLFYNNVTP
jgi:Pyruvate/2-oxoacid:ferredoxin oxidoreductase gamma subunit